MTSSRPTLASRATLAALTATTATLTASLAVVTVATAPPAQAAATDVVITELMYHAVSDLDGDDFLELTNTGTTPVDLSGWTFSGITLTVPAGTTIGPGARLVMAKDATQFQARYGTAPTAVYGGNLSNSGETVSLKDTTGATIDTVTYGTADPWPTRADGTGPSLELIDPTLENNDSLNWAAATNTAGHTAGAANSVRRTGLGPRITTVTPSTTTPAPNQPVTITATITGHTSATLRYRTDFG
uniref:lamin tail domain-containing protein n=1 Tax=Nocardioides dongkuii TaxID=2760089 RepID=UPI001877AFA2